MKRCRACLVLLVTIVGCAVTAAAIDRELECKRLVDKAVKFFEEKGQDHAVKVMNSMSGPFRKKEIFVYAMTFDGVFLAHPANKSFVGTYQGDARDAKGNPLFPPQLEIAKNQGAGWAEYWWRRHGEIEPTLKRTYVRRVPGKDIFLAAGYYVK